MINGTVMKDKYYRSIVKDTDGSLLHADQIVKIYGITCFYESKQGKLWGVTEIGSWILKMIVVPLHLAFMLITPNIEQYGACLPMKLVYTVKWMEDKGIKYYIIEEIKEDNLNAE